MSIKWHSGPPPSIGWWPVKIKFGPDLGWIRWWNGKYWSLPASRETLHPNYQASIKSVLQNNEWSDRPKSWPQRSRT